MFTNLVLYSECSIDKYNRKFALKYPLLIIAGNIYLHVGSNVFLFELFLFRFTYIAPTSGHRPFLRKRVIGNFIFIEISYFRT